MPLVLMDVVESLLQIEPEGSWAEADNWQWLLAGLHRPLVSPAEAHRNDITLPRFPRSLSCLVETLARVNSRGCSMAILEYLDSTYSLCPRRRSLRNENCRKDDLLKSPSCRRVAPRVALLCSIGRSPTATLKCPTASDSRATIYVCAGTVLISTFRTSSRCSLNNV